MRHTTAVLIVGSFLLAAMAGCAPERVPAEGLPAPAQASISPAGYAAATFESWRDADQAGVEERALPAVATMLAARAPEHADGWQAPRCEGAAGSTYCTWARPEIQLTIQVANEAASQGQPQAVTGAAFETAPGAVAIWPYTTDEQARNSQDQVDQGHSPWQLGPEAVAFSYADAVLGWHAATADPVPDVASRYVVTDTQTPGGGVVTVELAQPARPGDGGIWAVTRVDAGGS
ncbi:MAG: hypothetical protein ACRDZO_08350 [Egibacteraceae bacterium]